MARHVSFRPLSDLIPALAFLLHAFEDSLAQDLPVMTREDLAELIGITDRLHQIKVKGAIDAGCWVFRGRGVPNREWVLSRLQTRPLELDLLFL